jgi:hypothetical protein
MFHAVCCRAASTLLRRLEQTHATLMTVKHMLPSVPEGADALTAYELTHQSMQQFIVNMHTEWFHTIDNSISKQLQDNLLVQDKADRKCESVPLLLFLKSCHVLYAQLLHSAERLKHKKLFNVRYCLTQVCIMPCPSLPMVHRWAPVHEL